MGCCLLLWWAVRRACGATEQGRGRREGAGRLPREASGRVGHGAGTHRVGMAGDRKASADMAPTIVEATNVLADNIVLRTRGMLSVGSSSGKHVTN